VASLGETLRAARLARNLSLEQAEQACRVRRAFLEAFEAERYERLPPRAYAQGLLTVYARYLGLDPLPLIRLLPPEPAPEPEVLAPPPASGRPPWRVATFLGAVLLAVAAGHAYFQSLAAGPPPEQRNDPIIIAIPTATNTPVPATPSPAVTASPAPTSSPSPSPTASLTPTATTAALVALPLLTGQTLAQALGALQSMGLQGTMEQRSSTQVPAGIVIEQQPAPGSRIPQGDTVSLVVSRGPPPVSVPNIIGRSEAEARRVLLEAGLRPGQYTNYQGRADLQPQILGRVCVGCVLSSTPAPAAEVPPGTEVLLAVRKE